MELFDNACSRLSWQCHRSGQVGHDPDRAGYRDEQQQRREYDQLQIFALPVEVDVQEESEVHQHLQQRKGAGHNQ